MDKVSSRVQKLPLANAQVVMSAILFEHKWGLGCYNLIFEVPKSSTRIVHICCWKTLPLEGRKNCTLWEKPALASLRNATWRCMNALLNGNRQVALTGIFLLGMHDDLYESGGTPCNNQGHLHFHLSDKKSLNFFYLQNKVFERKQLLVFWLLLPVWIARKTGVTPAVALKQLYL